MKGWFLLITLATMSIGCLAGCTHVSSAETWIEYRRSGGFAGLDDHLVIERNWGAILTRKSERYKFALDSATINRLQTLFEDAGFSKLRREYLPSHRGSDLFEYAVTYEGHTVRTMDGAVPPSLQPVLEALNHIVENQGAP